MGVPEVDWIALYVSVSLHDYMKACRTPIKEIFKNMNYLIIVIYLESHLVGFFLLLINLNNYSQTHDIVWLNLLFRFINGR